ncbi:MAG: protein translocase subunit SecD [Candidatus Babeliaceae bacterium]|nr:protein translocase subunit SecD [Candidatus Babeliaceae bacterium]
MTVTLRRLLLSRLTFWILITAASVYFLFFYVIPEKRIKLGIDIAGGSYITLGVRLDEAIKNELTERMYDAKTVLADKKGLRPVKHDIENESIIFSFSEPKQAYAAAEFLAEYEKGMIVNSCNANVTMKLTTVEAKRVERDAVESNKSVLTARLNSTGLSEVSVVAYGDRRVVVELPQVDDPRQAKAMIGTAARLEIKPVEDSAASEQELLQRYGGKLPDGMMVIQGPGEEFGKGAALLVPKHTNVTGRQLRSAVVGQGGCTGVEPVVQFQFKPAGAQYFAEMTEKNVGRPLAIIIDGKVISAPTVQEPIRGGSGQISSSSFTMKSARQLALMMKSGAFVAPVDFEEDRHVGPALGWDSVYSGLLACGIGMVLLLLFCLFFYKVAGLLAFIVLLYNLLCSILIFAGLGATLTLPGIAGLILTVGIAVDASILIFERIREELSHGVPLRKAVDTGFNGALPVILDSNITSFLVALVLYWFGAGPIRGFAAAQIVGIVSTIITGLWLLRSFFTYATDVLGVQKIRF